MKFINSSNWFGLLLLSLTANAQTANHLQYFGYFGSAGQGDGKGNYISEVKDHSNVVWIWGTDDVEKLKQAHDAGLSVVLDVNRIFFDDKTLFLKSNYQRYWDEYAQQIRPYISSIIAFSPIDEPYCQGRHHQIISTQMEEQLRLVGATVKASFPWISLALILTSSDVEDLWGEFPAHLIPANYDWVGFDCYGSWGHCFGHSIPWYLKIVKRHLLSHQSLFLIPEGAIPKPKTDAVSESKQNEIAERADQYFQLALQETRVIGLFPWQFQDADDTDYITGHINQYIGSGSMPIVLDRFKTIGKAIVNHTAVVPQ